MFREFAALLQLTKPQRVILEGVERHAGSTAGMAALDSGDLWTLAYLVGGYAATALAVGCTVTIVTASQWKGQLNKAAVAARVRMANGVEYPNDHVTDAVGIGLATANLL